MNANEKIRSQARMNAEEIQIVIDEAKTSAVSISGLLVIREDVSIMVRLYLDGIQQGNNQDELLAFQPYIANISTELKVLNDTIISIINNMDYDEDNTLQNLEQLKIALLQLADIDT